MVKLGIVNILRNFFFSNEVNSDSKRDNQRLLNKDGLGWKELKWIDNEDEEI